MRFHGIEMKGKFLLEKLTSLPTWTVADEGRIIYNQLDKKLYVGTNATWLEAGGGGGYGIPVTNLIDNGNMEAGRMYFINTSTGSKSANLDSSPKVGDTITIVDIASKFDMYPFTINGNGKNVHLDSSLEVDIKDVILILVYTGVSWKLDVGGIVSGSASGSYTVEYNTNFTATAGMTAFVDTRNNVVNITLPNETQLATGMTLTVYDQYSTFGTNNCIVTTLNAEFENGTTVTHLTTSGSKTVFVWDAGSGKWKIDKTGGTTLGDIVNISTDYDANINEFIFVNSTSTPITITLPLSGAISTGDMITIYDQEKTFDINNITVIPSSGTINKTPTYSARITGSRVDFIWDASSGDWKIDLGGSEGTDAGTNSGGMGGSNPVPIIGNTTANIGDFMFVDTTSTPITVTLPNAVGLPTGSGVSVYDSKGTFNTHNVTVIPVNATIAGSGSFTGDIDRLRADFFYNSADNDWKIDLGGVIMSSTNPGGYSGGGMGGSNPVNVSENVSAVIGSFMFVDTTAGQIVITLPDSSTISDGASLSIYDSKGTFATHNVVINPVNATILGDTMFIGDINNLRADFFYSAIDNEWKFDMSGTTISSSNSSISEATTTSLGVVELATAPEALVGTDTTKAITAATLHATLVSHGLI